LRVPANADFDPETLRRLAEFSSADILVWGQYARFGEQIRIDEVLEDLKHNRRVPLKSEAPNEKQLLQSVAQLAQAIQQNRALPTNVIKELRSKTFRPYSESVEALHNNNDEMELERQRKHPD